MAGAEWRVLYVQVIRQDQQRFEVDDVRRVVGQQRFQRLRVLGALKLVPQQDSKEPIHVGWVRARNPQLPLTAFEPTRIAEAFEDIAQVNMACGICIRKKRSMTGTSKHLPL